jgi:hypothetical protein
MLAVLVLRQAFLLTRGWSQGIGDGVCAAQGCSLCGGGV